MWPWGHAAVGYLLYSGIVRGRSGTAPTGTATAALAIGTQFPDLVDKPLAWTLGVLAVGRSLGHSLLVAGVVLAVAVVLARRAGHVRPVAAFGVGYLSHVGGDALDAVVAGAYPALAFLAWPVLRPPPADAEYTIVGALVDVDPTPFFVVQLALTGAAVVVWTLDGRPGLDLLRAAVAAPRTESE